MLNVAKAAVSMLGSYAIGVFKVLKWLIDVILCGFCVLTALGLTRRLKKKSPKMRFSSMFDLGWKFYLERFDERTTSKKFTVIIKETDWLVGDIPL